MPNSQPFALVTVYIPCRNYGRFLSQAVESLFAQLYTNWEVIVVDEGSDDDTLAIADTFVARDPQRVSVIRNDRPEGLQKVANRILGIANGKYIMRLDADDWLDEGALLLMVAKLEANPDLGLVYGNYFYTDETGRVIGTERRHQLGSEDTAGHVPPHGACTLVRTRSLKAVGGYSEDVSAQDGWELWYKLQNRTGAASLEVPVFYYRQHDKSLSQDNSRLLAARARIFDKVAKSLKGGFQPETAAVIAVREDYPGLGGVPFREFEGWTLLARAILSATGSEHITSVIVSSQSERVLAYCEELERLGHVPRHQRLQRTDKSAEPSICVPMREIMIEAGYYHQDLNGTLPDIVSFLSLHALRRRSEHIDKALNVLRITESDSVVSVQEERDPVFSHGKDGLNLLNPGRFHDLAYERERLYRYNGAIIAAWWDVLNEQNLLGEKVAYIEMSAEDSLQFRQVSAMDSQASSAPAEEAPGGTVNR